MADDFRQSVFNLLQQLPTRRLDALKQLFWPELNYDRAHEPLSTRDLPNAATAAITESPTLFATTGSDDGFHRLPPRQEDLAEVSELLEHIPWTRRLTTTLNHRRDKCNRARSRYNPQNWPI